MTFCLDSIIIKPENNSEIKNAIVLTARIWWRWKRYKYDVFKLEKTFTQYNYYLSQWP